MISSHGLLGVPMMYSNRHLPDIEQWGQSSGSNDIPRRARPGLAGLRPHRGGGLSHGDLTSLLGNSGKNSTVSIIDFGKAGYRAFAVIGVPFSTSRFWVFLTFKGYHLVEFDPFIKSQLASCS